MESIIVTSTNDPELSERVSRYASHFYRDTFAKVCPPLGRNVVQLHLAGNAPICISHAFAEVSSMTLWKLHRHLVVGHPQSVRTATQRSKVLGGSGKGSGDQGSRRVLRREVQLKAVGNFLR